MKNYNFILRGNFISSRERRKIVVLNVGYRWLQPKKWIFDWFANCCYALGNKGQSQIAVNKNVCRLCHERNVHRDQVTDHIPQYFTEENTENWESLKYGKIRDINSCPKNVAIVGEIINCCWKYWEIPNGWKMKGLSEIAVNWNVVHRKNVELDKYMRFNKL